MVIIPQTEQILNPQLDERRFDKYRESVIIHPRCLERVNYVDLTNIEKLL